MIRIVRRAQLLTVLALLLAGLLQPLASAPGLTCARTHSPANAARQAHDTAFDDDGAAATVAHDHAQDPQPSDLQAPSAPCSEPAVPAERRAVFGTEAVRHVLSRGDQIPASPLTRSLFRPPRLS